MKRNNEKKRVWWLPGGCGGGERMLICKCWAMRESRDGDDGGEDAIDFSFLLFDLVLEFAEWEIGRAHV